MVLVKEKVCLEAAEEIETQVHAEAVDQGAEREAVEEAEKVGSRSSRWEENRFSRCWQTSERLVWL